MLKLIVAGFFVVMLNLTFVYPLAANSYTVNTFNMPPYVTKNADMAIHGLAIDIIETLFERANVKYKLQLMPQKRSIIQAQLLENTAVFPVQRSQERETQFKWVGPILITQTALFSLDEDNLIIDVFQDVFDYRILAVRGSADAEYLKNFGVKVEIGNSNGQNAKKIRLKRARLWAADTITASYYAKKIGFDVKQQLPLITTLRALAFHRSTPDNVIAQLNQILTQMYQDGSIKSILEKYADKFDIEDTAKFLQ